MMSHIIIKEKILIKTRIIKIIEKINKVMMNQMMNMDIKIKITEINKKNKNI